MRHLLVVPALVVVCLLAGCASVPPKRPLIDPVPRTITLSAETKLVASPLGNEYVIFAPGSYALKAEDTTAYYFCNAAESMRWRTLYPERDAMGGIGYSKDRGHFFIYFADTEENARHIGTAMFGPGIGGAARSSAGDGKVRMMIWWIPDAVADSWPKQ